jgi:hypothetical protein
MNNTLAAFGIRDAHSEGSLEGWREVLRLGARSGRWRDASDTGH